MASGFEITKLPEGTTRVFVFSSGNYYRLEDGSLMPLYSTLVWCRKCNDYREGEYLGTSLEQINQRLAELEDPNCEIYRWAEENTAGPGGKFRGEEIARWQRERCWRETRVEPPKCLVCGSTDVAILSMGEEIQCPFSTGTIIIKGIGWCDAKFNNGQFSPEGDRIPSESDSRMNSP